MVNGKNMHIVVNLPDENAATVDSNSRAMHVFVNPTDIDLDGLQ